MITGSDNFVLAYNQQVRGSSPLAPTRSGHVSLIGLVQGAIRKPNKVSEVGGICDGKHATRSSTGRLGAEHFH